MASIQASRPGHSGRGWQCGGGKMDLPLYRQICLHVSLDAQLHLSCPGRSCARPDVGWRDQAQVFRSFGL